MRRHRWISRVAGAVLLLGGGPGGFEEGPTIPPEGTP